jgi:hypothetical protein
MIEALARKMSFGTVLAVLVAGSSGCRSRPDDSRAAPLAGHVDRGDPLRLAAGPDDPAAFACQRDEDCAVTCEQDGTCCIGPCTCQTAYRADFLSRLQAHLRRHCQGRTRSCLDAKCQIHRSRAECRGGRCVAVVSPDPR